MRKDDYLCDDKAKEEMNESLKYVRFDWAAKRILRDKANFDVLEGLVTVLLGEPIHIVEILESESNQDAPSDKYNRVDIKAKNSNDEIIIVEIQLTREIHYLQRILYGVAKAITEHISLGERYDRVKKVYSINILYFDLGRGSDYLYHGRTTFIGVHTKDTLQVSMKERENMGWTSTSDIFPEYYLIRVNEFDKVATTPLEEWIDYLKTGRISDETTAPGLGQAREKLLYMKMSQEERQAYEKHLDYIMSQNEMIYTAKIDGRAEGLAEGLEEGMAKGLEKGLAEGLEKGRAEGLAEGLEKGKELGMVEANIRIAKKLKAAGKTMEEIKSLTDLTDEEIAGL